MKPIRIAINGFGRIGRIFFRQAYENPNFKIVAINDLGSKKNLLYLLKYDSVYGKYETPISEDLVFLSERDPARLPWKDMNIDVVVESTGVFESYEKAKTHLSAGAKRVVITAPVKDDDAKTFTPNVGVEMAELSAITSNASCTTNATTPVVAVMMETVGIAKAVLNTVHGYTASQALVDSPIEKDFRRGRAAAHNITPSSTGAAVATAKAIPGIANIFDGIAMRVPVISGSLVDFTFVAKRKTSVEEINDIFKQAEKRDEWKGILKTTEEPIVSSDIIHDSYGAIIDLNMTRVVDGDLVKILSWYDNEWGYSAMLLKHVESLAQFLSK
ncbi:MAG: type I glyceraldehyde-3-phosphate dehydrogenase [Candidatus Lloydbacteria bacterium]|nr:type I glyceraldehyde-3-phosphate dehydrogenase [Candidatus Lloydbacteria bacterium]